MKAKDIRKGTVIIYKDAPHSVMDFQHRTPGNLRAFVQAKLRNLLNGTQTETRFSSTEDLPIADVYSFDATFLYREGSDFHFMNTDSYDQITLTEELLGDSVYYLVEEMKVQVNTFNEAPISVNLPKTVVLVIEDTEPELKGASVSNAPKPAKTNTGLTVTVPTFLKIGDKIVVDTESGAYLSRAEDK